METLKSIIVVVLAALLTGVGLMNMHNIWHDVNNYVKRPIK